MNKTELIEKIADETNGSKNEAQKFFDAFTTVVESELKRGNQVQITGFGKFYVQQRDARFQGAQVHRRQRAQRLDQVSLEIQSVPRGGFLRGTLVFLFPLATDGAASCERS
jgi:nucleoid DNA-binding protein